MSDDLVISPRLRIPADELHLSFARSSGPGGQNVNKVNTKVVLRWDVSRCRSLPADVRGRFIRRYANRINQRGELVLSCDNHRQQLANRVASLDRLANMVRAVASPPKQRVKTKPSRASQERRLRSKKALGDKKRQRRTRPNRFDD